jgi:hypothetical protein
MPRSTSAERRSDQEFADLTANRARLEAESDKLLAAHFADAIDLPTLKRHQDRIRAGLADMNQRLAEHDEHHAGGRAFLHDSLRLLTDAHRAYAHSDDANRRLANQAFYTRLEITDDEQLRPRLAEPFATIVREATSAAEARKPNGNTPHLSMSRVPVRHFGWSPGDSNPRLSHHRLEEGESMDHARGYKEVSRGTRSPHRLHV